LLADPARIAFKFKQSSIDARVAMQACYKEFK